MRDMRRRRRREKEKKKEKTSRQTETETPANRHRTSTRTTKRTSDTPQIKHSGTWRRDETDEESGMMDQG